MARQLPRIRLVAFDIDGTLTDGTTWYAGEQLGWVQRYSVRDGEACLRLGRRGLQVAVLSRNKTQSARRRMELLGIVTTWLGVPDKLAAFEEMIGSCNVASEEVCFVGDGREDAPILARAGVGLAVADAHPDARAAADHVLSVPGGRHAMEHAELFLEATGRIPVVPDTL